MSLIFMMKRKNLKLPIKEETIESQCLFAAETKPTNILLIAVAEVQMAVAGVSLDWNGNMI